MATAGFAGPDDPTRPRRHAFATLLHRTFGEAILDCPTCGERMELIAAIEQPAVIERILPYLGLSSRAPPRGPWSAQRPLTRKPPAGNFDTVDPPAFVE